MVAAVLQKQAWVEFFQPLHSQAHKNRQVAGQVAGG